MGWVGRDLKAPLIPPVPRAGTLPPLQGTPSPVQPALDVYKNYKPSFQFPNHTFFFLSQTNHGKHSRNQLQAQEPPEKDSAQRLLWPFTRLMTWRAPATALLPHPHLGLSPAPASDSVLFDHGGFSPSVGQKYILLFLCFSALQWGVQHIAAAFALMAESLELMASKISAAPSTDTGVLSADPALGRAPSQASYTFVSELCIVSHHPGVPDVTRGTTERVTGIRHRYYQGSCSLNTEHNYT